MLCNALIKLARVCINIYLSSIGIDVAPNRSLGKFDWRFRYVIIFLHVQFWIRLAAVSYRGKKVRTVSLPVVRSVNKSRGTWNCVQNEQEYAICVIFTTALYYNALGLFFLWSGTWQIRHDYTRLNDGHCDVTGHRKMSVLGVVGTMVTNGA